MNSSSGLSFLLLKTNCLESELLLMHLSTHVASRRAQTRFALNSHNKSFIWHTGSTRRGLLLAAASITACIVLPLNALARPAWRSISSRVPAVLTVVNGSELQFKVFWINFDGDTEFYTSVGPGETWTVDTYQSHSWRIVDGKTQTILQQYTASAGDQVLQFGPKGFLQGAPEGPPARTVSNPSNSANSKAIGKSKGDLAAENSAYESDPFDCEGFDGIGGTAADYAAAKVKEVVFGPGGGCASIQVEGYALPLPILVGNAEAMTIAYANGVDFRRPPTISTWLHTLQATGAVVDRVVVTRVVGSTFYARILLTLPGNVKRAVDSRPSDGLALALQSDTPLFVAKQIANDYADFVKRQHSNSPLDITNLIEDSSLQASAGMPMNGPQPGPQGAPSEGPLEPPRPHRNEAASTLPMRKGQTMRNI